MAEIPPGTLSAVRAYAANVVGCDPRNVTVVDHFKGGNRHAVYKVSYLDSSGTENAVVVRVSHGNDPAERSAAEREARVLEKVGGVAAPVLLDFRANSEWLNAAAMCMQFVPGYEKALSEATPAEIERLGSVVGWVHTRPTGDLIETQFTAADLASYGEGRLHSIMATLMWIRDPFPSALEARLRRAARVVQKSTQVRFARDDFTGGETLALLHGDIAGGNVLWGPKPVLIDWEYARLGDPADEIAYTFDQNGLTAIQREAFWRGYAESVGSDVQISHLRARADWWEPVTLLGSTLWWVERWIRRTDADAAGVADPAVAREQGYYFDHLLSRLDRLDGLLASERGT
jgi:aminoglycoside phosphotransferase (APT) family kinase protein